MGTRPRAGRSVNPAAKPLPDELWSTQRTADYLGITVNWLWQLNHMGTGPRYLRAGKRCRYDPRDVQAWLERNASDADTRDSA